MVDDDYIFHTIFITISGAIMAVIIWTPIRRGVLDTALCDKDCQWLDTALCDKDCQWLATGPTVSSTNNTDRHDITEILLKVALNTIKQTNITIS